MIATTKAEQEQYAPGMPMDELTFAHDFGDYIVDQCMPLSRQFGTTFALTQTGGWCMALQATMEGGDYLLVTDADDILSPMPIRRRCWRNDREILGYSVGYYTAEGEQLAYVRFKKARDAQAVGIAVRACLQLAWQVRGGHRDPVAQLDL